MGHIFSNHYICAIKTEAKARNTVPMVGVWKTREVKENENKDIKYNSPPMWLTSQVPKHTLNPELSWAETETFLSLFSRPSTLPKDIIWKLFFSWYLLNKPWWNNWWCSQRIFFFCCSLAILSSAQGSILLGLKHNMRWLGMKPTSAMCKESVLPTVLPTLQA